MRLFLRMAMRNARRNVRRTLLTASTVVVGVALVTLGLAWLAGIFGQLTRLYSDAAGHVRIVDAAFQAREELQPLYENLPDVQALATKVEGVPGVVAAEPRILTGVLITTTEEIGDDFTPLMGATERYYTERLGMGEMLADGRWLSGAENEVVLGRKVASQVGAKVGDKVLLLGQTQYGSMSPINAEVVGVVGSNSLVDSQAFTTLSQVQWLADMEGGAIEVLVYGADDDPDTIRPIVDALRALPELKETSILGWYDRPPWSAMLGSIGAIRGVLTGMFVLITALAIFNTMTMSVLERTAEIGVMRAMGLSGLGAVGLFVVEAATIGLLGGIGGALIGGAAAAWLERVGVTFSEGLADRVGSAFPMQSRFYADLTAGMVIEAVLLGLLIAVLGALLPSLRAATIEPVTAMRIRR